MSSLTRPWRRWAIAAPAGSFVIAVFVLAPGGIPAIGMPAALEVGAGGQSSPSPSGALPAPTAGSTPRGAATPVAGGTAPNAAATARTVAGTGSHPRNAPSTSSGVTVVSAQQPVVVTAGGGQPGDDDSSQQPTRSPGPSPSPTGSWGGGPGDE